MPLVNTLQTLEGAAENLDPAQSEHLPRPMENSEDALRKKLRREYDQKRYSKDRTRLIRMQVERNRTNPKLIAYRKAWRIRNRAKINARALELKKINPEPAKISSEKWRKKNLAACARQSREWRRKYPSYYLEYWRAYRNKHRGAIAAYRHAYKARKRGADVNDQSILPLIIMWKSKPEFTCYYCGVVFEIKSMHVEHRIPLIRGGKHSSDNICQACPRCNLSKRAKTDLEFIELRKSQCA